MLLLSYLDNKKVWLRGLADAFLMGALVAAFDVILSPQINWKLVGATALFGGITGMKAYVKMPPAR